MWHYKVSKICGMPTRNWAVVTLAIVVFHYLLLIWNRVTPVMFPFQQCTDHSIRKTLERYTIIQPLLCPIWFAPVTHTADQFLR